MYSYGAAKLVKPLREVVASSGKNQDLPISMWLGDFSKQISGWKNLKNTSIKKIYIIYKIRNITAYIRKIMFIKQLNDKVINDIRSKLLFVANNPPEKAPKLNVSIIEA